MGDISYGHVKAWSLEKVPLCSDLFVLLSQLYLVVAWLFGKVPKSLLLA